MKNIYATPEFKRVAEFTNEELKKINVKSLSLMQEVLFSNTPAEPTLKIRKTTGREYSVIGYDDIMLELRSMIKKIDFLAESKEPLYSTICNLIISHMPGIIATYVGADIYRITKTNKQSIDIVIRENEINNWLETGAMSIGMIGRQLVVSIESEFERKYGYTKQLFHFNGVYWSTDKKGDGYMQILDNDEIQVMLANTTGGIWNENGKFEKRHDARTWNCDESFESVMRKYRGVSGRNANLVKTLSEIPAPLAKPTTNLDFMDITTELYRIYEYPDGKTIKIKLPVQLNVSKSGGHRVLDNAGMSHYIPAGWRHLYWKVKPGMKPFSF